MGKTGDREVKRGCTDLVCLVLFIAMLGGMGYVGYLGVHLGNPYRLFYGYDSYGNICNMKNDKIENADYSGQDLQDEQYLFYYSYPPTDTTLRVCVSKCPDTRPLTDNDVRDLDTLQDIHLCRYDIDAANVNTDGVECPTIPKLVELTPSSPVLGRCVPDVLNDIAASSVEAGLSALHTQCDSSSPFENMAADVTRTADDIGILCAIALGIAFVMTMLMRFFAPVIIWLSIAICGLGSMAGAGFCWYKWWTLTQEYNDTAESLRTDEQTENIKMWQIIAIAASAAALIVLLILLVMRKRIALVVQLFREAGKAVAAMPLILFVPLQSLLILVVVLAGCLFLGLYVLTAANPLINTATSEVRYESDEIMIYMRWFYLFCVLWVTQFIVACHQIVIAGAVVIWYFTKDKSKFGAPILASICTLCRYHLGTVAFGSLIIALIQLARIILGYIQSKLQGRTSKLVDFLLKVLACCLWCFEKLMKFINKNAYIMVAIDGRNFCLSARAAFQIIVANILRVAAVNSIGAFCLLLGKLGVTAVTVFIALQFLQNNTEICYLFVPIVLVAVFALFIAHTFLSTFGMTIDTILLCFCVDANENDGDVKPYYMSKGLMEFVNSTNKKKKKDGLEDENNNKNNSSKQITSHR